VTGAVRIPWRVALAAATVFSTLSCSSGPDDAARQSGGSAGSAIPSSGAPTATPAPDEDAVTGTAIKVRLGDTVLTAYLRDVPAARDLVTQLPLTLTFRDLNNVEKTSRLPRKLSMDGVPAGDDPAPRDVGYYAPSNDLVLYYGDVGYFPGIVRLGRFDGSVDVIRDQTGDFAATVELG
jgi:hypothetical protein